MRKALRFQSGVIALLPVLVGLSSCKQGVGDQPANIDRQNEAIVQLPDLPAVEPPLDRRAILVAIEEVASAAALGKDDRAVQTRLDGKRIEVRIRFGCPTAGPGNPDAPFRVQFAEKDRTLRVRASPDLVLKDIPWRAAAKDAAGSEAAKPSIDMIEGFWIRRPWLFEAGCPAKAPDSAEGTNTDPSAELGSRSKTQTAHPDSTAEPTETLEATLKTLLPPRVGIAQYFTKQDSRLSQRGGRPYEATKVLPEGQKPSSAGYDLVLAGRLRALPGGKVVDCHVQDIDQAPVCIIFTQLDSVRIETPGDKSLVAEWSRQ